MDRFHVEVQSKNPKSQNILEKKFSFRLIILTKQRERAWKARDRLYHFRESSLNILIQAFASIFMYKT